jgi:hypothetical protein
MDTFEGDTDEMTGMITAEKERPKPESNALPPTLNSMEKFPGGMGNILNSQESNDVSETRRWQKN